MRESNKSRITGEIFAGVLTIAMLWLMALPAQAAASLVVTPTVPAATPQALCVGGTNGQFTAKLMSAGSGTYTETQTNAGSAFASLSPNTPQIATNNQVITYTLTPLAITSATQSVTITATQGGTVLTGTDQFTVNGGPQNAAPAAWTFDGTATDGSGTQPKTFSVMDQGQNINVTATINSPAIATFSNGTTTATAITVNGTANFTVTPVGPASASAQSTTISFVDAAGCSLNNAIKITVVPGSLTLTSPNNNPPTLNFNGPSSNSLPISGTDYNYGGSITATAMNCVPLNNCAGIVKVTPTSTTAGGGSTFSFSVKPQGLGNATIAVAGSTTQNVRVLVNGASLTATGGSPVTFGTGGSISGAVGADITSTPITVSGALQTSSTGTGSVYIGTPGDIKNGSGTLPISALSYNCSLVAGADQGAALNGTQQLSANSIANPCMTFNSGQYSSLNFNLNLILNKNAANALPAGTYSSPNGFTLYISAT
jgi:hypothetical protein